LRFKPSRRRISIDVHEALNLMITGKTSEYLPLVTGIEITIRAAPCQPYGLSAIGA
jgi:hypothetical protein